MEKKNREIKRVSSTLLSGLLLLIMMSCGKNDIQYKDINLQAALNNSFSNARDPKWSREGSFYKVNFIQGHQPMVAWFDDDMAWRISFYVLSFQDLPEVIINEIEMNGINPEQIVEVCKVIRGNHETMYEITLEKGGELMMFLYSLENEFRGIVSDFKDPGMVLMYSVMVKPTEWIKDKYPNAEIIMEEIDDEWNIIFEIEEKEVVKNVKFDVVHRWVVTSYLVAFTELSEYAVKKLEENLIGEAQVIEIVKNETPQYNYYYVKAKMDELELVYEVREKE